MFRGKLPTLDYYHPPPREAAGWQRLLDPRRARAPLVTAVALLTLHAISCGNLGPLLLPVMPVLALWYVVVRIFQPNRREIGSFRSRPGFRFARLVASAGTVLAVYWCVVLWGRYYPWWIPGVWRRWWHPWIDLEPAIQILLGCCLAMLLLDLFELYDWHRSSRARASRRVVPADLPP